MNVKIPEKEIKNPWAMAISAVARLAVNECASSLHYARPSAANGTEAAFEKTSEMIHRWWPAFAASGNASSVKVSRDCTVFTGVS